MKLVFKFAALVIAFIFSAGCNVIRGPDSGGSKRFLIPWSQGGGNYSLQVVELSTLADLSRMEGSAAKIRFNQSYDKVAPEGQFIQRSDGVYIPTDVVSMQMVGAYAHMEKLAEFEDSLGLSGIVPRPRFVSVETIMGDGGSREYDNAVYYGNMDVVAVLATQPKSALPIALNAGILAHEHFHSLFFHSVLKNLGESDLWNVKDYYDDRYNYVIECGNGNPPVEAWQKVSTDVQNRTVLLALNEGLADYWAWLYSRDEAFVERSVKVSGVEERRIQAKVVALPDQNFFRRDVRYAEGCFISKMGYRLGTAYASFMRTLTEKIGTTEAAKLLQRFLKRTSESWPREHSNRAISPNALINFMSPSRKRLGEALDTTTEKEFCCLASHFFSSSWQDQGVLNSCQEQRFMCD